MNYLIENTRKKPLSNRNLELLGCSNAPYISISGDARGDEDTYSHNDDEHERCIYRRVSKDDPAPGQDKQLDTRVANLFRFRASDDTHCAVYCSK